MFNITLIVLAVLIPTFFLFGFRWGVMFDADEEKAAETPIIPKLKKKPKESDYQRKKRIEAENIENYHDPWSRQEDIR